MACETEARLIGKYEFLRGHIAALKGESTYSECKEMNCCWIVDNGICLNDQVHLSTTKGYRNIG